MILSLIVAMSENHVIGKDNKLPWHLPEDLKHFKKVTMGCPIIMGRKTFQSIGRLLPGRKNIILTRQENLKIEGAVVVKNLEEAIHEASTSEQAFIIGGAELYREALPYVKNIYLTIIHKYFEGDAKFPKLNFESEFRIISKENHDSPDLKYSFLVAERI